MNKTFLTVFALVGIFLCGAVVGGVVAARLVPATVQKKAADQQLNSQQWLRITNRLHPTDEQKEKIRAAVAAYMQQQQTSQKIGRTATDQLHDNIRAILTPAQVAEYDKIRIRYKENEKLWQRWLKDQRAKYGDAPLITPSTPTVTGGKDSKDKDGKPRSEKKASDSKSAPTEKP